MTTTEYSFVSARRSSTACGRYTYDRLTRQIGETTVYRGINVRTGVEVELEIAARPAEKERRRIDTLTRARHPNAELLLDVTKDRNGSSVLVFDARRGQSLLEILAHCRRMPPLRAIYIVRQLLGALEALHRVDACHGAIRPSCIMVDALPGFEDRVTLTDIGVHEGWVDPRYAAPECVQGETATVSSDLYSVGVVLYELISGVQLADGTRDTTAEHMPLHRRVPVCAQLAGLVENTLSLQPALRPSSAQALAQRLEELDLAALSRSQVTGYVGRSVLPSSNRPMALETDREQAILWATQVVTVWVLVGDPALDRPEVREALLGLPGRGVDFDLQFLEDEDRAAVLAKLDDQPPPWVVVFGDMHVLTADPLLTALVDRFAELSRILVSTHQNLDLLQSSVNACGLDACLALPLVAGELGDTINRMVERTRALRFHYDGLRLALKDMQDDIESARYRWVNDEYCAERDDSNRGLPRHAMPGADSPHCQGSAAGGRGGVRSRGARRRWRFSERSRGVVPRDAL